MKACNEAIASGQFSGAEAANLRGMHRYQRQLKDDATGALSDYGSAIEFDPWLVMTFNNRGNIYRDIGDYDKALADYDARSRLIPTSLTRWRAGVDLHPSPEVISDPAVFPGSGGQRHSR